MKKNYSFKALIFVSLFMLVSTLIFIPKNVLAFQVNDNQVVDTNKVWTIRFTGEVGFDSLTQQGITVVDSKDNTVNVSLALGSDNKSITVTPTESGYIPGESYTLTVGKSAHSKNNISMKQDRIIHFSIKLKAINKIDDINTTVNQNASYSLPSTVKAYMSDGSTQNVNVTWDKQADTTQTGTFIYYGSVSGYSAKIKLTLTVNKADLSVKEIVNKYGNAVVYIEVSDINHNPIASGSGFIVCSSGLVVTNFHVIKGCAYAKVVLQNGTQYDVEGVLGYNNKEDIAILKLSNVSDTSNLPVVNLGDSDSTEVGDSVVAIGSPEGYSNTVSTGIISGLNRNGDRGFKDIQTTAGIAPGSSGGALFNMKGDVIGITYAGYNTSGNIGFVIPINEVSSFLNIEEEKTLFQVNNISIKPQSPVGVQAWTLSSTKIAIQWNSVSGVDGYYVYYSDDNSTWYPWEDSNGNKKLLPWQSGYSATLSGISAGETVYFKVTSVKNNIESDYSTIVSATTQSEKPQAPTGIEAWTFSGNKIAIQWNNLSGVDGYYLYYSTDKTIWYYWKDSSGNKKLLPWQSAYSASLSNVPAGQTVYFKVTSVKNNIESDYSNVVSATIEDTSTKYFPLMSDVPQPNTFYDSYNMDDSGKVVGYYYSTSRLSSSFLDSYFTLLNNNGFQYYSSDYLSDGTPIIYYTKNSHLVGITIIGNYLVISGTIR
jgi:Trypsin-like serine proteases, typically periplasmic, contain C-terminal PDZ domain